MTRNFLWRDKKINWLLRFKEISRIETPVCDEYRFTVFILLQESSLSVECGWTWRLKHYLFTKNSNTKVDDRKDKRSQPIQVRYKHTSSSSDATTTQQQTQEKKYYIFYKFHTKLRKKLCYYGTQFYQDSFFAFETTTYLPTTTATRWTSRTGRGTKGVHRPKQIVTFSSFSQLFSLVERDLSCQRAVASCF